MSEQAEVLAVPAAAGESKSAFGLKWKERLVTASLGGLLPVLVVLGWQWMGDAGRIDTFFIPTPLMIAAAFRELIASGELAGHLIVSLKRAAAGFAVGGALGLAFGILVGFSRRTESYLDPTFQMLRMIPHLALSPLIILWFGFGETSKVFIIANGAFFPLYINTFLGIRNVDNKLFEVSDVLEFNRLKQITRLVLPSSVPNILLGLRLSLAISWLGLVVAEMIGSKEGIGYLIHFGQSNSRTELIFAGIIIFAIIGKLVDSLVRLLDRKLLGWRDSYKG